MKQKNNIHADRTPMADVWGLSFPPRTELICKGNTKKKKDPSLSPRRRGIPWYMMILKPLKDPSQQ